MAPKASKEVEVDTSNVETIRIKWSESNFKALCVKLRFPKEYEAQFPAPGYSATDNPDDKITVYADWFDRGNLRFPVTKFLVSILRFYGIHLSQLHMMGLCRITHFEYCCWALAIPPRADLFNLFYRIRAEGSWFSFSKRQNVVSHCGKVWDSARGWKERFFYVKESVVPVFMYYRPLSEDLIEPEVDFSLMNSPEYKQLTERPADLQILPESALVGVGMSRIWDQPEFRPVWTQNDKGLYPLLSSFPPFFCIYIFFVFS
jgi:hypothetical protein